MIALTFVQATPGDSGTVRVTARADGTPVVFVLPDVEAQELGRSLTLIAAQSIDARKTEQGETLRSLERRIGDST